MKELGTQTIIPVGAKLYGHDEAKKYMIIYTPTDRNGDVKGEWWEWGGVYIEIGAGLDER